MEFTSTNRPRAYVLSPIWKLSPKHNHSNLLDSYELQEVTKQLNRAICASNGLSTPRSSYLRSPIYSHWLDRIYKQNAKTSKKISSSKRNNGAGESTMDAKGTRGFVMRLWKKVKQGLHEGTNSRAKGCSGFRIIFYLGIADAILSATICLPNIIDCNRRIST